MSSRVVVPQVDLDNVVTCFRNSVRRANSEEEVRVWVSRCIEELILEPLGIKEVRPEIVEEEAVLKPEIVEMLKKILGADDVVKEICIMSPNEKYVELFEKDSLQG